MASEVRAAEKDLTPGAASVVAAAADAPLATAGAAGPPVEEAKPPPVLKGPSLKPAPPPKGRAALARAAKGLVPAVDLSADESFFCTSVVHCYFPSQIAECSKGQKRKTHLALALLFLSLACGLCSACGRRGTSLRWYMLC